MPNPILLPMLIVKPNSDEPKVKAKAKVGDLLVQPWGTAKTVRNRVCKIVRIEKVTGQGYWKYTTYKYDVQWLDGKVEKGISQNRYETFEEYKGRLDKNIETHSNVLNKQYEKRAAADVLESKAKKAFGVE